MLTAFGYEYLNHTNYGTQLHGLHTSKSNPKEHANLSNKKLLEHNDAKRSNHFWNYKQRCIPKTELTKAEMHNYNPTLKYVSTRGKRQNILVSNLVATVTPSKGKKTWSWFLRKYIMSLAPSMSWSSHSYVISFIVLAAFVHHCYKLIVVNSSILNI